MIHNLSLAREWAPPGARLRAMVKANAYGHGIDELIRVFAEHADELGVATVDEGLHIRSLAHSEMPVFVMSRAKDWDHPDHLLTLHRAGLTPAISSVDELRLLLDRLGSSTPCTVELKLDTGMGRLGIQRQDIGQLVPVLRSCRHLRVSGILTHFAASDEQDLAATREQERVFREMVSQLPREVVAAASIHSCNSGALLQRGLGNTDIGNATHVVRPGVMLYGAAPSANLNDSQCGRRLRQVGRWTTRVIELRTVPVGGAVGYGGTWRVEGEHPAMVAVLAVGYADGFNRLLGNRARVIIRGASFPVIGRVSMDLISVLVDGRIRVGDDAVLLGSQQGELGRDNVPAWEMAELRGTIPYEVWTGIGPRVARVLDVTQPRE